MFVRIGDFRDLHVGATAYVVGKGPSLQWLKADHFGEGPVITINESIGKVESLNLPNKVYSFYKDGCKVYDSRPDSYFMAPHRCTLPLSTRNAPTFVHDFEAPHCFTQYHNRVGFDNRRDFGISPLIPSAPTIVSFVKLLGCRKIVWLCMDSFVTGDIGSYGSDANGECRYLNRQSSYYQHRAKVYSELERLGIEHEWVLPESEAQPSGKIKLLIATPFYPFFGYSGYIRSLFQLSVLLSQVPQIEFNFLELTGHCYVDNVRNVISSRFLQSDYTDLLFYDSVTHDTPIMVRRVGDNYIDFKEVSELIPKSERFNGLRTYCKVDYEVLTRSGWQKPNAIVQAKVKKPVLRVTDQDGTVCITEDHSLFSESVPIAGRDLTKGVKLDHISVGEIELPDNNHFPTTEEYAEVLGFFAAEGTCGRMKTNGRKNGYFWAICNTNLDLIIKYKAILESVHSRKFIIIKDKKDGHDPVWRLSPSKPSEIVSQYESNFYTISGKKRVPKFILNAPEPIIKAFLSGYEKGDGGITKTGFKMLNTNSMTLAAGLHFLYDRIGMKYGISSQRIDKPDIVVMYERKHGHSKLKSEFGVRHVQRNDSFNGWVYDLNTNDGSFVGGVGMFVLHNSDMEVDAVGFSHLLMRQEEVVGAVYRRKNDWEKYNGEIFINPDRTPVVSESGLIKAKILPTGLMKIKRTVFEKMAQHYVDDFYYTPNYTEQGEPLAPSMVHNFFGNIIDKETRSYHGEDSSFCIRWQAMGGELWLEPKITITHYGLKGYEGNFHDYLTKLPGGSNHKPSNTVVEDIWEKCDYRRGSAGERYADRFLDYVPHGATVNDYGSGTGRGTVAIKKLRPDVTVNMVDIARNALEYETMELMGHGVTFTFSDLSRLPEDFPVSDWGYCVNVMMLLEGEALDNAMLEMRRTCRNLFMEVYDYPDWRLGEDRTKTKQPASWWREKLSELWEQVTYLENFDVPGRYVFVCRSEACAEPQYRKKLNAIFYFNGSDKGYFGHCYGDFYETLLKPFVGKKIRLLEIGLNENDNQHIPSLLAWREYLGERAEIVGLDIRDFRHMAQPGMAIEMGDQRDVECLDNLASKYGPFDIIIDDGSHDPDDQIASFRHLWWCLNPGGVYAIEDLLSPRNDALVKYLSLMNTLTMTLHQSSSGQQKLLCIRKE